MPHHLALHVGRDLDFTCSIAALIGLDTIDRSHPDERFTLRGKDEALALRACGLPKEACTLPLQA